MGSGIHIETIEDPRHYTHEQLERARRIAELLGRGRIVLCETPGL